MLDERWVFHENAEPVQAGPGVVRRVLAYSKDLMCVENTFEEGAVGSLHHHPHTQITYVVSGEFEFNIDGEKKTVRAGDTMLKLDGVEHGCVCRKAGILLDIFNPMRGILYRFYEKHLCNMLKKSLFYCKITIFFY